eukprot:CAMPEP_0206284548 /NCGR_PEP_ID=MMETSP0047_2-20121206/40833_1 /ASSEMBLY_ACC=CAM_ASM_000192 /TAXON_ID=195065 /ORGANISM="Chroomonas mesostigmatica_cf, Strain CCMP1168" /LENGTH=95 /DNA_ID=CAMNT_0053715009 /DNA_START=450 /DNA_END=737 /DNA_ORIENTATION=+
MAGSSKAGRVNVMELSLETMLPGTSWSNKELPEPGCVALMLTSTCPVSTRPKPAHLSVHPLEKPVGKERTSTSPIMGASQNIRDASAIFALSSEA